MPTMLAMVPKESVMLMMLATLMKKFNVDNAGNGGEKVVILIMLAMERKQFTTHNAGVPMEKCNADDAGNAGEKVQC